MKRAGRPGWLGAAIVLASMAGAGGPAHACPYRLPSMEMPPDQQLAAAREVSVARVVQASALGVNKVMYEFVVIKRLLGPYRERFTITSDSSAADDVVHSYDHSDERFWKQGGGRLSGPSNWCYIEPRFDVGQTYLVFHDKPYSYRSFERINFTPLREPHTDDKWYAYVEQALRARAPK